MSTSDADAQRRIPNRLRRADDITTEELEKLFLTLA